MSNKLVSIIIPLLNEIDNIDYLVNGLNSALDSVTAFDIELIFVDDGSTDGSYQKLVSSEFGNYSTQIIKLSKNFGSHAAARAGILKAKGDYITNLTADLQDPPQLPTRFFAKISQGYDIVWGYRNTTRAGFFERTFSRFYVYLMNKYAVANFPPNGMDVFMISRKVATELNRNIESNSSLQLQILNFGFNQSSILYDKSERKAGKSKWTLGKKIKLLIDSFVAFSYAPIRFVTIMGFSFFIVGSIWMLYIIGRKLIVGDLNAGWPALVSILLIGFGLTNISLGIIAEYLWRTLDASRKRPVFIIDKLVERNKKTEK